MKHLNILMVLLIACFFNHANAQDTTATAGDDKIYEKVDIETSFAGGDSAWRKFMERNINGAVSSDNGAPPKNYIVIIQFVVEKDGQISNLKALTKNGYGMEKEVIRALKAGPPWVPAKLNGKIVRAYRKQPVTFVVMGE